MTVEGTTISSSTPSPPTLSVYSSSSSTDVNEFPHVIVKRKRSKRPRYFNHPPTEEEYLAFCLLMLARGKPDSGHQMTPFPSQESLKLEYACSVCRKVLNSYQALGGHKASHRKPPEEKQPDSIAARSATVSATNGRIHKCSICSKTFASGQALGGHKRCHYEGNIGSGASRSGVTPTSLSGNNKGLYFDLNLPALPEFNGFVRCGVIYEEEEAQSPLSFKKPRLLPAYRQIL